MYHRNEQNNQNSTTGYVHHPGGATYYYQDPYTYYSAPGAMGGNDHSEGNYYFPYTENYSQFNHQAPQLVEQKTDTGDNKPFSRKNNKPKVNSVNDSKTSQWEPTEYERERPSNSNFRGGYRGNQRGKNSSYNTSRNSESMGSYRSHNNYQTDNYSGIDRRPQNNNSNFGQGHYGNQFINNRRNIPSERKQNDESNIPDEHVNKQNLSSQRDTTKRSTAYRSRNKRQYPNISPRNETSNNYEPNRNKNSFHNTKSFTKKDNYSNRNIQLPTANEQEKYIQLRNGLYECNVCMDRIYQNHPIWSCQTCFNSFHLKCVSSWIRNSLKDETWRCPACNCSQNEKTVQYRCFCKKVGNPPWNRKETPHSCGQLCKKKRGTSWCVHGCPDLCHPGPCPPCAAFTKRKCACGKLEQSLRCSDAQDLLCDNNCDKLLNCGVHNCRNHCHTKECQPCDNIIEKTCYCSKSECTVICTAENTSNLQYSCEETCNKMLSCGFHTCRDICHPGECMSCDREVSIVTHCPCGKKTLAEMKGLPRKSCVDPIMKCDKICGNRLKCGNPGNFHTCAVPCHEGTCPPCPKDTSVRCRCGSMNANILCAELNVKADEVTCKKSCKKLRHCGRHKCGTLCCIDDEHICTRKCNRLLTCKIHRCEDLCHRGHCKRCLQSSFDELTCHCGYSIMNPPIQCGAQPPSCDQPCVRSHPCQHPQTHKCHQGSCPPCTELVSKLCCGKHKFIKATPCYVSSLSCGSLCEKGLTCGVHKCQKVCHEGECQTEKKCVQMCEKPRLLCGHPCGAKCHKSVCRDTNCKVMITISCICGSRKLPILCSQNEKEFQAVMSAQLASKLYNSEKSVDLSVLYSGSTNQDKFKRLICNEECKLKERNQRLALALQIVNPEARDRLGDSIHLYSDQLKEDAKRDFQFTGMVHDQLNDLVIRARESTQKNRSYSFAPMNRDKRRFIHEYSKHFGCESKAYDEEPKKNVVVTATRGLCYLPPFSILNIVQREAGNRKVPAPYLNKMPKREENVFRKLEKSNSQEKRDEELQSTVKTFDYFDME